uniref:Centromere protein M n=1 Tax=Arion vulgaris TaxID=1028688 RepID=A0A0B7B3U0_9EUPU
MDADVSDALNTPRQSLKILRPFNALRHLYSPRTILVICSENCLNIPEDLKTFTEGDNGVHVHFTTKLPIQNYDKHPAVDAVVLVYKVFNQNSLKTIRDSIPYIDVRYLVGKCFILVTSDAEFHQTDVYEIETLANSYMLPIHYISKVKNPDGRDPPRLQIPSSLMSIYCPPVGSDVNSLIINAAVMKS